MGTISRQLLVQGQILFRHVRLLFYRSYKEFLKVRLLCTYRGPIEMISSPLVDNSSIFSSSSRKA
jgi:hypothetical protein